MSIILVSMLLWLVAGCATAQHRSLPGKPDARCYLPGDIQAYPPTGCTNDVIYCGWDGDIANQHNFIWILHKNVCPSGEILNNRLNCVPGNCGPQPNDPCTELREEVPYDIGKECTPYFLICLPDYHNEEELFWWGLRCLGRNERYDKELLYCVKGKEPCSTLIKPDAEPGDRCYFLEDFQSYPDLKCGPDALRCGLADEGRAQWFLLESRCEFGEMLTENLCVPIPEECKQ